MPATPPGVAEGDTEPQTQRDAPTPESTPQLALPEGPWARLVGLGPTASFGILDLRERQVVIGKFNPKNQDEGIRIADPRISKVHCRLFIDGNNQVQLLDESSNGTWWNHQKLGKGKVCKLSSMDQIVLLHPNPNSGHAAHSRDSSSSSEGDPEVPEGVVPRAINYQFMFIDLRPAPPPMPMPPPPMAPPKQLPSQPQLLRNTSLCAVAGSEMGSADDYEAVCSLGRGSFAVVQRVRHKRTGVEYAMKVMEKSQLLRGAGGGLRGAGAGRTPAQYAELQDKVLSEARILRGVDHPNVIKFVDIFETDVHLCLVMELVEGGELYDHLVNKGPFAEADARAIMYQLLQALKYLHDRNIVHRDLKPENILLQAPQENAASTLPVIKIADFGLAKLVGEGAMGQLSTFCGTPQYFAPEVLESRNHRRGYDRACDMWSVGVLMYILLSGSPPFFDDDVPEAGAPNGVGPSQQQHVPHGYGPHHGRPPVLSTLEKIREGVKSSHFAHTAWDHISPTAKHLICQLLVVDPRKRLRVEDALSHRWMRGETNLDGQQKLPFSLGRADEIEDSDDDDDDGCGGGGPRRVGHGLRGGHPGVPSAQAAYQHHHHAAAFQPPFAKRQKRAGAPAGTGRAFLPLTHEPPPGPPVQFQHHQPPPHLPQQPHVPFPPQNLPQYPLQQPHPPPHAQPSQLLPPQLPPPQLPLPPSQPQPQPQHSPPLAPTAGLGAVRQLHLSPRAAPPVSGEAVPPLNLNGGPECLPESLPPARVNAGTVSFPSAQQQHHRSPPPPLQPAQLESCHPFTHTLDPVAPAPALQTAEAASRLAVGVAGGDSSGSSSGGGVTCSTPASSEPAPAPSSLAQPQGHGGGILRSRQVNPPPQPPPAGPPALSGAGKIAAASASAKARATSSAATGSSSSQAQTQAQASSRFGALQMAPTHPVAGARRGS